MTDPPRGPLDFLEGPSPDFLGTPIPELMAESVERSRLAFQSVGGMVERSLRTLLGPLEPGQLRDLAGRLVLNSVRNDLLVLLHAKGRLQEVLDLVEIQEAEGIVQEVRAGRPMLFTFIHTGPRTLPGGFVSRLGLDTVALGQDAGLRRALPHLERWTARPGSPEGQLFLKHALGRYREGVCILMAVDGKLGEGQLVHPCLGRLLPWAKGVFTMQKLTGAPVVPILPRWRPDGSITCSFGEPLCAGGPGQALEVARVASWAESLLREDPSQIRIRHLVDYVNAEPAAAPMNQAVRVSVQGFGSGQD